MTMMTAAGERERKAQALHWTGPPSESAEVLRCNREAFGQGGKRLLQSQQWGFLCNPAELGVAHGSDPLCELQQNGAWLAGTTTIRY